LKLETFFLPTKTQHMERKERGGKTRHYGKQHKSRENETKSGGPPGRNKRKGRGNLVQTQTGNASARGNSEENHTRDGGEKSGRHLSTGVAHRIGGKLHTRLLKSYGNKGEKRRITMVTVRSPAVSLSKLTQSVKANRSVKWKAGS